MGRISSDVSHDAVIVVPGIMGSELVETETGTVLWGLANVSWYVSAWTSGASLDALRVTEADRVGRCCRVTATRLLRVPAFAPVLRGVEPYHTLVIGVRRAVAHPAAVLEFPYDWRLSVAHNAALLADAAQRHLTRWRGHQQGSRDARLVLVAHSMGGLLARYFTGVLGCGDAVRATVTLGTPFYGSVKAAHILSTGRDSPIPLPRRRLRELALTMPGIYDLLPAYRCVDEGASARRLTPGDVAGIGADAELAGESLVVHERLARVDGTGLRTLVGVGQPTMQSLVLRDGTVDVQHYACEQGADGALRRVDRRGDSTVYREAASMVGVDPAYLPQTHAGLAATSEAIAFVRAVLTERPLGPPLGAEVDEIAAGVEVPDVVTAGTQFDITVRSDDPALVSCRVVDVATGETEAALALLRKHGALVARTSLARPGVYRVEVDSSAFSPVLQMVMAVPADDGLRG